MSREGYSPHEDVPPGVETAPAFEIPENMGEIQTLITTLNTHFEALSGMMKEMAPDDLQREEVAKQIDQVQSHIAALKDSYAKNALEAAFKRTLH